MRSVGTPRCSLLSSIQPKRAECKAISSAAAFLVGERHPAVDVVRSIQGRILQDIEASTDSCRLYKGASVHSDASPTRGALVPPHLGCLH